jgi:hypothetical protein
VLTTVLTAEVALLTIHAMLLCTYCLLLIKFNEQQLFWSTGLGMLTSTVSGSVGAAATAIRVAVGAAALAAGIY